MKVELSKALVIGDKTFSRSEKVPAGEGEEPIEVHFLDLDLEALTGADIKKCAQLASIAKGEAVRVLVTDLEFHIQVAAKASGIDAAVLEKLPGGDYVGVATSVQAFLTRSI